MKDLLALFFAEGLCQKGLQVLQRLIRLGMQGFPRLIRAGMQTLNPKPKLNPPKLHPS